MSPLLLHRRKEGFNSMYRKTLCERKIEVCIRDCERYGYPVTSISIPELNGLGFLTAIDRKRNMVAVKFVNGPVLWFHRAEVKPFKWLDNIEVI